MKRIEELLSLINQKIKLLNSESTLRAIYLEEIKTISLGDVTHGRVLRIPIEDGYFLSFPVLLEFEINDLLSLFNEADQKRIKEAINLQKSSVLFC